MKKGIITALGLVSLLVLSYVGIAQLGSVKKDIVKDLEEESKEEETMPEITLPSGLRYRIDNHGTGEESPKPGQTVTVHYTGWLDDAGKLGTKFDSSVDRGRPFSFVIGVGQVIKGWDEGVLSMHKGEKRHLIIPPALGYGARGAGNLIPPDATLHFDVELLDFK